MHQSSQQRVAAELRMHQVKGVYSSKDQRLAKKQEVQKANFQLGGAD
jgi:hypothetical protein